MARQTAQTSPFDRLSPAIEHPEALGLAQPECVRVEGESLDGDRRDAGGQQALLGCLPGSIAGSLARHDHQVDGQGQELVESQRAPPLLSLFVGDVVGDRLGAEQLDDVRLEAVPAREHDGVEADDDGDAGSMLPRGRERSKPDRVSDPSLDRSSQSEAVEYATDFGVEREGIVEIPWRNLEQRCATRAQRCPQGGLWLMLGVVESGNEDEIRPDRAQERGRRGLDPISEQLATEWVRGRHRVRQPHRHQRARSQRAEGHDRRRRSLRLRLAAQAEPRHEQDARGSPGDGTDSACAGGEDHGKLSLMTRTPRFSPRFVLFAGLGLLLLAAPAEAKNHLWKFSEFYSNADGTIQFIEMQECCGSDTETQMSGANISSDTNTYDFPNDLVGPTARTWILIATAGFAALPGAPAPDFIIPDGFFDPAGDTLRYRSSFDIVPIGPGQLPTDGVTSLERTWPEATLVPIVNSPTNFAGVEGSVSLPAVVTAPPMIVLAAALAAGSLALARRRARSQPVA